MTQPPEQHRPPSAQPWYDHAQAPAPVVENPYTLGARRQQPPPPPRGGFLRSRLAAAIGGFVAALLVVGAGAGVYALNSGTDTPDKPVAKPTPGTGSSASPGASAGTGKRPDVNAGRKPGEAAAWAAWSQTDLPRGNHLLHDLWFVGDLVVQAAYKEVVAYKVADGSKVWSVPLPAKVCDTPVNPTPDGKVVVAYANGNGDSGVKCNQLQMIDLKSGKTGWHRVLPDSLGSTIITHLAISGDTLLAGAGMSASAFQVTDGRQLFTTGKDNPGACYPHDVAGGAKLLQIDWCALSSDHPYGQIKELDPRTGKVKWRYRPQGDWKVGKVLSVEPLVVTETLSKNVLTWRAVALNANGTRRSVPDIAKYKFDHCGGAGDAGEGAQNCPGAAADATGLALSQGNKLAVFDLANGKLRWAVKADGRFAVAPLRVAGPSVIAYVAATPSKPGLTVEFGPKGGNPKKLLNHATPAQKVEYDMMASKMAYRDKRLIIAPSLLDGDDKVDKARMLSFAPGPS
ncbi:PQQ-binding-like beta-propeller repeat protein [Streptomyces purpureus]|uniref:outer membrane protein assembly factor BamB family protein n=1 Tax=Streptomyces purpureus TaxID=1951 RepID=UPI00035C5A73|nr:PQQ-binding-like beta-propeller repeat protein [Streptomyces purpureus]